MDGVSVLKLNDDVIQEIFGFLEMQDFVCIDKVLSTSRIMLEIYLKIATSRKIKLCVLDGKVYALEWRSTILSRSIAFKRIINIKPQLFISLVENVKYIHRTLNELELQLGNNCSDWERCFEAIAQCQALSSITLIASNSIDAQHYPFSKLARNCPTLRRLNVLSAAGLVFDGQLSTSQNNLLLSGFSSLAQLVLSIVVTFSQIQAISNLPQLETLQVWLPVNGVPQSYDEKFDLVEFATKTSKMEKLQTLLCRCHIVYFLSILCPNVTSLDFIILHKMDFRKICKFLSQSFSKLQNLTCENLELPIILDTFLHDCASMENLVLNCIKVESDEILHESNFNSSIKLKSLQINKIYCQKDELEIILNFTKDKFVDLIELHFIDILPREMSIICILFENILFLQNLQILIIENNYYKIDNIYIFKLLLKFTNLRIFHLITEYENIVSFSLTNYIFKFLQNNKNLINFKLNGICDGLDVYGLFNLFSLSNDIACVNNTQKLELTFLHNENSEQLIEILQKIFLKLTKLTLIQIYGLQENIMSDCYNWLKEHTNYKLEIFHNTLFNQRMYIIRFALKINIKLY